MYGGKRCFTSFLKPRDAKAATEDGATFEDFAVPDNNLQKLLIDAHNARMALLKTDLDDKLPDDEKKDFEELVFDLEELWKEMMVPVVDAMFAALTTICNSTKLCLVDWYEFVVQKEDRCPKSYDTIYADKRLYIKWDP